MEEWLIRIYDNGTKALILLFQQTKQLQDIPWKVDDFIAWELLPFLAILFALIGAIHTIVCRRKSQKHMTRRSNTAIIILACILSIIVISIACVYYLYTTSNPRNAKTIGELSLPVGYKRVPAEKGSYAAWLRSLPLKKRGTKVYTYKNRELANFQWLSTGVVDMPLLTNDEQCADVCMRMRAEYLFSTGQYSKISFPALNGEKLTYTGGNNRNAFEKYLRNVFGRCNTTSLHHSLKTRKLEDMQIGDIFVYPHRMIAGKNRYGHAVMVADMAVDKQGKKIFILIEGNTPARDIHVLRNLKLHHNPWFHLDEDDETLYLNVFRFKDTDLKYF